jgi:hypothetical protein
MALIEVQTAKGPILVEVTPGPGLKGTAATDPGAIIGKAETTLEEVLDAIARVGEAALGKLSELPIGTIEVTLGVKFSGKGKFFFAEAAGEAALTVKLGFKGKAG